MRFGWSLGDNPRIKEKFKEQSPERTQAVNMKGEISMKAWKAWMWNFILITNRLFISGTNIFKILSMIGEAVSLNYFKIYSWRFGHHFHEPRAEGEEVNVKWWTPPNMRDIKMICDRRTSEGGDEGTFILMSRLWGADITPLILHNILNWFGSITAGSDFDWVLIWF